MGAVGNSPNCASFVCDRGTFRRRDLHIENPTINGAHTRKIGPSSAPRRVSAAPTSTSIPRAVIRRAMRSEGSKLSPVSTNAPCKATNRPKSIRSRAKCSGRTTSLGGLVTPMAAALRCLFAAEAPARGPCYSNSSQPSIGSNRNRQAGSRTSWLIPTTALVVEVVVF